MTENDIACYAMASGERIIGKLTANFAASETVTIENPRIVYEQIDPRTNQIMVGLIPMNGAESIELVKTKINYRLYSNTLSKRYIEETTTIKTPPKAAQSMLLLEQNQRGK